MIGDDTELRAIVAEETVNAEVAAMVRRARTEAGLSQTRLARLLGTSQPTIARLEDAEYEGHSLTMLKRIAAALNLNLELRFVRPSRRSRAA